MSQTQRTDGKKKSTSPRLFGSVASLSGLYGKSEKNSKANEKRPMVITKRSQDVWLHYHMYIYILKHHDIASAVRPHRNLRQIQVHPKYKVEDKHKTDCVYQIPCKTCNMCYIGETGRTFGTRLEEYKKSGNGNI